MCLDHPGEDNGELPSREAVDMCIASKEYMKETGPADVTRLVMVHSCTRSLDLEHTMYTKAVQDVLGAALTASMYTDISLAYLTT